MACAAPASRGFAEDLLTTACLCRCRCRHPARLPRLRGRRLRVQCGVGLGHLLDDLWAPRRVPQVLVRLNPTLLQPEVEQDEQLLAILLVAMPGRIQNGHPLAVGALYALGR